MKHRMSPLLFALILFVAYALAISVLYLLFYGALPDQTFLLQVVLLTGVIGVMPLIVRFYYCGLIFYAGGILGMIVDGVTSKSFSLTGEPMAFGGWAYLVLLFSGFIIGMIVEVIMKKKRTADLRQADQSVSGSADDQTEE